MLFAPNQCSSGITPTLSLSKHISYIFNVSLCEHTFPFLYLCFFCPCFLHHLITATHPLLSTRLSGLADYGGQSLSTTGTGLDVFTSTCVAQPGWLNGTLQSFNFVHLAWNLHIDMSFSYLWTSLSFRLLTGVSCFWKHVNKIRHVGLIIQKRPFVLHFYFIIFVKYKLSASIIPISPTINCYYTRCSVKQTNILPHNHFVSLQTTYLVFFLLVCL